MRLNVREGWINKETGRVGDPRIQFLNIELLDGIINSNSKKITLKVDSKSINNDDILKLKSTLTKYKGSSPVYFDIHDSKNEFKNVNLGLKLLVAPLSHQRTQTKISKYENRRFDGYGVPGKSQIFRFLNLCLGPWVQVGR